MDNKNNYKKYNDVIRLIDPNSKIFKRTLKIINKKIAKKDIDKIKTK